MSKKDKQHYLPQSYLRYFSPDIEQYRNVRGTLTDVDRRKAKRKLKVHFFDIQRGLFGLRNIQSLARENRYLLPSVDDIIKDTEKKLPLLGEIIEEKSEEFLYQSDHRSVLWEIARNLRARSIVFRNFARIHNSIMYGKLIRPDGTVFGELSYTDKSPEFFQTGVLTNDMRILLPLLLESYRLTIPSEGIDGTLLELSQGIDLEDMKTEEKSSRDIIPTTVYPILIRNHSKLPFITGDACIPASEYLLHDLKTRVPNYYFPISPDLAILFLESEVYKIYIPRQVKDTNLIHKWNRLMYNCSDYNLFSNSRDALLKTTKDPKEEKNQLELIRNWSSNKEGGSV